MEAQGGAPTLALIRAEFGERVAEIVAACTDADVMPKPPWRQCKEAYIAHLADASPSVLLDELERVVRELEHLAGTEPANLGKHRST